MLTCTHTHGRLCAELLRTWMVFKDCGAVNLCCGNEAGDTYFMQDFTDDLRHRLRGVCRDV
eukprot:219845-Pelagomonas_calceolata.AAC.2